MLCSFPDSSTVTTDATPTSNKCFTCIHNKIFFLHILLLLTDPRYSKHSLQSEILIKMISKKLYLPQIRSKEMSNTGNDFHPVFIWLPIRKKSVSMKRVCMFEKVVILYFYVPYCYIWRLEFNFEMVHFQRLVTAAMKAQATLQHLRHLQLQRRPLLALLCREPRPLVLA